MRGKGEDKVTMSDLFMSSGPAITFVYPYDSVYHIFSWQI